MEKRQFLKTFFLLSFIWSLIVGSMGAYLTYEKYQDIEQLALLEAQTSINKDFAFRSWIASKGGVYVPISNQSQPNQYLKVPNRELNTSTGIQLTLFNPAYALRQMTDSYSQLYGTKSHLTSLKLLNPNNKPSEWEKNALTEMEHSKNDFYRVENDQTLYYMRPFMVEASCLKCHAHQGYTIGDVRGGLSIEIPLERYRTIFVHSAYSSNTFLFFIWILGLIGLYWGYRLSTAKMNEKLNLYEQNLFSLVSLIEQRDNYTAGHGRRVGEYSRLIAQRLGLDTLAQDNLYRAGMLHDVGKIAIPDSILLKPGKLETIEKQLIEEHVNASYDLLGKVNIFSSIAETVRHHHERLDGSGYPDHLRGDQIPFNSQILGVADCFDAMTTNRIYKGRKDLVQAKEELLTMRGTLFDATIVDAAIDVFSDIQLENIPSQRPQTLLEMERFSYFYKDPLTGAYSTGYLNYLFFEPDFETYKTLCFVNIHHMNQLNKEQGWEKGDEFLKRYAQYLQEIFPDSPVIRYQGDDFIIFRNSINTTPLMDLYHPEWLDEYKVTITLKSLSNDLFKTSDIDALHAVLQRIARE